MKRSIMLPALFLGAFALNSIAYASDPVTGFMHATGQVINNVATGTVHVVSGVFKGTGDVVKGVTKGTGDVIHGVDKGAKSVVHTNTYHHSTHRNSSTH